MEKFLSEWRDLLYHSAKHDTMREQPEMSCSQQDLEEQVDDEPELDADNQERVRRGGELMCLAQKLAYGDSEYHFRFTPQNCEEICTPAAREERQRRAERLIEFARSYAACPQRVCHKDEPDFDRD